MRLLTDCLTVRPRAWVSCLVLLLYGWMGAAAAQAMAGDQGEGSTTTSSAAQDLFARAKPAILQVRVLLASVGEQSSLGSGFVVQDDGAQGAWVVTNYHVVSQLALHPQRYRLELRGTDQQLLDAQLVAIDVVHDLAILRTRPTDRTDTAPGPALQLSGRPLAQGATIYSLGNPLELGFLISEGIYNGLVENRLYEQMLFSGSINSGMSGGPALDREGRVVGVNVATRRDGEQLSFLVPVRYLRPLLERARQQGDVPVEWRTVLARQLLEHQQFVMDSLLEEAGPRTAAQFTSQSLAGRSVPALQGAVTRCWAQGQDSEQRRYFWDRLSCDLQEEVYVGHHLYTGSLSMSHTLTRNERLSTAQFLALDSGLASAAADATTELAAERCLDDYVRLASGRVFRVATCLRAYRKFPGLYNYALRAMQVDDARERLVSVLSLRGFAFDNARRLGQQFLESLQ